MLNATSTLRLSSPAPALAPARPAAWHVLVRAARAVKSLWCVLNGGHFKVLHTEPERLALRCVACGHTTPGWDVRRADLTPRYPADRDRLRIQRPAAG